MTIFHNHDHFCSPAVGFHQPKKQERQGERILTSNSNRFVVVLPVLLVSYL